MQTVFRPITPQAGKGIKGGTKYVMDYNTITTTSVQDAPDYGFSVDSGDECEAESEAEPRGRYREGLYCPLRIGQVLDQRYCIEHKLGWDGFSTVWLARDLPQNKLVALKVLSLGQPGEDEYNLHCEITRRAGPDVSHFLVTYLAVFYIRGLRSKVHTALVLPWRGPSLTTLCYEVPVTTRVPAARRLLMALKRLHDAGFVHRELNSGSVMWDIGSIDHWSTTEIYQRLGRPRKALLTEEEGSPGELVEPAKFPHDMIRPSLHLGDFSHAISSGAVTENKIQFPHLFCAPERFHGADPSFASDMWSFTCILFMLYTRHEFTHGDGLTFVSRMVGSLGPFPEQWKGCYAEKDTAQDWWYDQTGQMPRSQVKGGYETLEKKIDRLRPDTCRDERDLVLAVMRKGFCYDPEQRITAEQLLEDPSFNALMYYYKSW